MTFFDKLTTFRRLAGSVPFVRSRKNFYSRFLSRVSSFNVDSDYSFINLDNKSFLKDLHFRLIDVFEVPSSCLEQSITINVYVSIMYNDIIPHLYFRVNV